MIRQVKLYGTTDSSGDLTVTSEMPIHGKLYAVEWIDGALVDGVDAVISVTNTDSGVDQTLLTLTNANNDAWYYPRYQVHDNAGAGVTYDGTNEIYNAQAVLHGYLKLVVSSGGDTKAGGCVVYYDWQ